MAEARLVSDFYNITDHEIIKLAATKNPYWQRVREFWESNSHRKVLFLSEKQAKWLSDIEAELEDKWRPQWMEEENGGDDCF
jgi:hypothetical protein